MSQPSNELDRRRFLQTTAAAGLGATAVGAGGAAQAQAAADAPKIDPKKLIRRNEKPDTEYRRLGRTNFMTSRIVAGWIQDKALVRRVFGTGVNYCDNARGYGQYEVDIKPFLARNRDKLWLTSKATGIAGYNVVDAEVEKLYRKAMKTFLGESEGDLLALHKKAVEKQAKTGDKPDLRPAGKRITQLYVKMLHESLERMGVDDVDCYMVHGIEIPWIFDCTELWDAYAKAHKEGKIKHFGFSSHKHQKPVLAAAVEANRRGPWKIDLVMPGVNPASFDTLKPELASLEKQDVGVIAMKTSGIKNRPVDGREKKFNTLMGGKTYNEYERAKLWMLHLTEGLVDAVIAQVKNTDEMSRTFALPSVKLTAAAERELEALVKFEMAGACHLCGDCETHCPEHIAVTDMIRYHAYIHQYDETELARELYQQHGYDPSRVCNNCGKCSDACTSDVRITELLHQLSRDLA